MAYVNSPDSVTVTLDDKTFDAVYKPGSLTFTSGIYRCRWCRYEVVSTEGHTLPPQDHQHDHGGQYASFPVEWQLAVRRRHEQRWVR